MKVISDCNLLLDYLLLEFGNASLPSYCEIDFSYRYSFEAISLLRDVKNVQVTWVRIAYNLVLASDGPAEYSHRGFVIGSLQAPRTFGSIWTLSTSSTAMFSTVCSVSSRLV